MPWPPHLNLVAAFMTDRHQIGHDFEMRVARTTTCSSTNDTLVERSSGNETLTRQTMYMTGERTPTRQDAFIDIASM